MAVFGMVLLIGAYTYRLGQKGAATTPLTEPLLQSLALIFMALAGVFIAVGLFVAAQALRQALKARRASIGSGFRDGVS